MDFAMDSFDYESKLWGGHEVKITPTYLGALRLRYCLEDLKNVKGKILEVGCGAGGMAKAIKSYRPDLEVYGCDISRNAIQQACQNPEGVIFKEDNAYDLSFESEFFSAAIMFDLLEHLRNPIRAIEETRRVLANHGIFHLFVPCEGELFTIHGLLNRCGWQAKEKYGGHIQRFTIRALQKLLVEQGFSINRQRWSCHLFNQLVDVMFFSALSIRGKNTQQSVEGYLSEVDSGLVPTIISGLKSAVAILSYFESRLLPIIPGSGVHLNSGKIKELRC